MNQLKLNYGNDEFSFCIENSKLIYGLDYAKKFKMVQMIRQCMNKNTESEYQLENKLQPKLFFNERMVDARQWSYFEINPYFDLQTDLKMGTRSLSLAFFDAVLGEIEFNDAFNTINQLFAVLSQELNDQIQPTLASETKLQIQIQEASKKTLLKDIDIQLLKDGYYQNVADLDYDDYLILLLDMIIEVSKKEDSKKFLVVLDLPHYPKKMMQHLMEHLKKSTTMHNLFILMISNNYLHMNAIKDYVIVGKHVIDLANENQLIDHIINNISWRASIEELVEELHHIIANTHTERSAELLDYL